MKKIHVAQSPLTNNIYAGNLSKDGRTWRSTHKCDVTLQCLLAVAAHGLQFGKPIDLVSEQKSDIIRITVEIIKNQTDAES